MPAVPENAARLETLGRLADARAFHDPLALEDAPVDVLLRQLRLMMLIRTAEEQLGDACVAKQMRCPVHLGIGQEAIAVGVSANLRNTDRVFGTHRSHAHFLALGAPLRSLFAEVLGREGGTSRGLGGSMHLAAPAYCFLGCVPIVAATIPIAVGAGLAAKMDGSDALSLAYFGDGACEEGVLHESLNLAASMKLPVFFAAENNLYSSHLLIDQRQPSNRLARFAEAHGVEHEVVDGNDVVVVARVAARLAAQCRAGQPVFLEAVTYRWRGHVGPQEDQDVGVRRSTDLSEWKKRDPIQRLGAALCNAGHCTESEIVQMQQAVRCEVGVAWDEAMASPPASPKLTLDAVFADPGGEVSRWP